MLQKHNTGWRYLCIEILPLDSVFAEKMQKFGGICIYTEKIINKTAKMQENRGHGKIYYYRDTFCIENEEKRVGKRIGNSRKFV